MPTGADERGSEAADLGAVAQHRRELVAWAQGAIGASAAVSPLGAPGQETDAEAQALLELRFDRPGQPLELTRLERSWAPASASPRLVEAGEEAGRRAGHFLVERPQPCEAPLARRSHLGFQIHNRYLVTESDEGMVVIDQHALHERILYEQLREKVLAGDMETQRLLVPEPVTLPPAEAAAALESKDILSQLGIDVEPFGGDTILVSSYPAMLANLGPGDLVRQVVEQLVSSSRMPDRRDLLDELLHMIACKAAVKAGDRLAPEEITALLEQRQHYQDAHHCPHGRPTALIFTREELDRRFKRT